MPGEEDVIANQGNIESALATSEQHVASEAQQKVEAAGAEEAVEAAGSLVPEHVASEAQQKVDYARLLQELPEDVPDDVLLNSPRFQGILRRQEQSLRDRAVAAERQRQVTDYQTGKTRQTFLSHLKKVQDGEVLDFEAVERDMAANNAAHELLIARGVVNIALGTLPEDAMVTKAQAADFALAREAIESGRLESGLGLALAVISDVRAQGLITGEKTKLEADYQKRLKKETDAGVKLALEQRGITAARGGERLTAVGGVGGSGDPTPAQLSAMSPDDYGKVPREVRKRVYAESDAAWLR